MINIPFSSDSQILGRHCIGNCNIPSRKRIAFSGRILGVCDRCTVICSNRRNLRTTVSVKGYCVVINIPFSSDSQILGRHCVGNRNIPSRKRIAFSGRILGVCDSCAIICSNRRNLRTIVSVKGYCVVINIPFSSDSQILGRHCIGNCNIPSRKRIAFSGRILGVCDRCTVICSNRRNLRTTVGIKGYCITIYGKSTVYVNIVFRHNVGHKNYSCGSFHKPSGECVALFSRNERYYSVSLKYIISFYENIIYIIVNLKNNLIKATVYSQITCRHCRWEMIHSATNPSRERFTVLTRFVNHNDRLAKCIHFASI